MKYANKLAWHIALMEDVKSHAGIFFISTVQINNLHKGTTISFLVEICWLLKLLKFVVDYCYLLKITEAGQITFSAS